MLVSLFAGVAEARVFNITSEKFASYFLVNNGYANIKKTPFENESSGGVTHSSGYSSILGGEFGFLYATPMVNFRFGFGIIKPANLKDVTASNSTDDLYSVNSDLQGFVPKMGVEVNFSKAGSYRVFGVASYGSANITMKNTYILTAAGQAAYSGVANHTVEAKGSATEMYGGLGAEIHMTDTTTFMVEGGYRSLKFSKLTYAKAVDTFTGAQASGATVLDADGNQRALDFTGVLVTVGFRFYM
jgi:hypothetical protein